MGQTLDYDVIVVGARVAGAAAATLMARDGLRVLLVDRDQYRSDTLSTHALMRGGVLLLSRWGLLDRIVAAGTPPVRQTRFHYGADATSGADTMTVTIKPLLGVEALYAPRRTVLDSVLVDAAAAAGTDIRFGFHVTGLLRDRSGRVCGVRGRDRSGGELTARSWLTVGADGARSTVARMAGAATLRLGAGAGAIIYGYWSGLPVDGYEWFYRPGHSAGMIPTNDAQVCVFAGAPASELVPRPASIAATYRRLLDAATGGADGRLRRAHPPARLKTWVGRPSFIRQAAGHGWALVGDAGSFLDPLSTHGITDALRDAQMLARQVITDPLLGSYEHERNEIIVPLFEVVDRVAAYGWDMAQLRRHLLELSSAMSREVESLAAGSPVGRVPS